MATSIYLPISIDEMNPQEKDRLEDYIIQQLHSLYGLRGQVPTVLREGTEECKELERRLEKEKNNPDMQNVLNHIIKRYREQIIEKEFPYETPEYPALFPPPPWVRKKKREVIEVVA
jgi:hypothetical protein